jgi:hypothetical protein
MPKKTSNNQAQAYDPADLLDPLAWINLQSYGQLKEWLREAIWHQVFLPVVIPHNTMPASYLAQLLLQSEARIKTHLRTIIPELIKEWGASDNPRCLDDLLILCGNLNCNEAEIAISRIITEKLTDKPDDIKLRLRALSVLQEIGTDKSLHLFKRYIGDLDYAPLCYRSLYLLNLSYAVTELHSLVRLYHRHEAVDELADVLKILFKYTLKPQQYMCVLQPLVEQAPAETFVEVLELLHSINVFNEAFFRELPSAQRVEMLKQIMKRARKEDCERISDLLRAVGGRLDPPPELYMIPAEVKSTSASQKAQAKGKRKGATHQPVFFLTTHSRSTGYTESVPVIPVSELGADKIWGFTRNFTFEQSDIMELLEGPDQREFKWT